MTEKKKKGILSMFFGKKNSCCCDMKIEEVTEEEEMKPGEETNPHSISLCCGIRPGESKHVAE